MRVTCRVFPPALPEIRDRADFRRWIGGYDTGIHYADYYVVELSNVARQRSEVVAELDGTLGEYLKRLR